MAPLDSGRMRSDTPIRNGANIHDRDFAWSHGRDVPDLSRDESVRAPRNLRPLSLQARSVPNQDVFVLGAAISDSPQRDFGPDPGRVSYGDDQGAPQGALIL